MKRYRICKNPDTEKYKVQVFIPFELFGKPIFNFGYWGDCGYNDKMVFQLFHVKYYNNKAQALNAIDGFRANANTEDKGRWICEGEF